MNSFRRLEIALAIAVVVIVALARLPAHAQPAQPKPVTAEQVRSAIDDAVAFLK